MEEITVDTMLNEFFHFESGYPPTIVFSDWVEMMAIAFSNILEQNDSLFDKREKRYIDLAEKYSEKDKRKFSKLTGMIAILMETEMKDYLGDLYMRLEASNNRTGQFFTPYHISEMVSKLTLQGNETDEIISINEPSCGSGGMIIATASKLKEDGINYQTKLRVLAQDLDWRCVYMTFVQMELLGIDAIVIQGNSLKDSKPERGYYLRTLRNKGVLF